MKEFAFPISVKCANLRECNQLLQLLQKLGYVCFGDRTNPFAHGAVYVTTGIFGVSNLMLISDYQSTKSNVVLINDFNLDLIRDIASVCKNQQWQMDEPKVSSNGNYLGITGDNSLCYSRVEVNTCTIRRPTIKEVCDHYGYYIDGKDIIKKDRVKNSSDTYARCTFDDYANNSTEKTAVAMLRYVEAKTGCKYSLTKIESVETKLL